MRLLLALLTVVVARYSSAVDSAHANSHGEARSLWQAKNEFLASVSKSRIFHTLSTTAEQEQCKSSFETFQLAADTCLPAVGGIFAPNTTDTLSTVGNKIETYCAPQGCNDNISTAATAVKRDCMDTGVFRDVCSSHTDATSCTNVTLCEWTTGTCRVNDNLFPSIKMVLSVFCLKSDAAPVKYCVPSFFNFVTTKSNDAAALETQLNNGCDDCTLKMFRVWSKVEPLRAAVHFIHLANQCLKRKGKFCAVHQMQLEASSKTAGPECGSLLNSASCDAAARGCRWKTGESKCEELWTELKLDNTCHPCTLVYAKRVLFAFEIMDRFSLPDPDLARRNATVALKIISYVVNGVCSTDLEDKYCLPRLQAKPVEASCAGVTNLVKSTGCCGPSFIDFAQGLCSLDQVFNPASTCQPGITLIKTCLGDNLGQTCAVLKYRIVHEALLTGISAVFLAANEVALKEELRRVIAFAMGIDIALIIELKIAAVISDGGRRLLQTGTYQVTTILQVPQAGAYGSANEGGMGELEVLGLNDLTGGAGSPALVGQSVTNVIVEKSAAFVTAPFIAAGVIVLFL